VSERPSLSTNPLLRILWAAQHLNAISNPVDYALVRWLHIPRSLRLSSGATLRATRADLSYVNTVIRLAHLGVSFEPTSSRGSLAWEVSEDASEVRLPSGIRLSLRAADPVVLAETFLYESHFVGDDLRGRSIVDIGANIGDTALYYASKGAHVLAFEPDPVNYRALVYNLSLNPGLSALVTPLELAIGVDGRVEFGAGLGAGSSAYSVGRTVVHVESLSLSNALRRFGVDSGFLLKADCKGCETSIVSDPAIRQFSHVQIEYTRSEHRGDPTYLVQRLRESGFSQIRVYKHNLMPLPLSMHGLISASSS